MQKKIIQVQNIIDSSNFDAFLFISSINRFWLTSFNSSYGFLVITKKESFLYLDGRYYEKAKELFHNNSISIILFKSVDKIIEDLKKLNLTKILMEEEYLLASEYLYFQKHFSLELYCTKNLRIIKDKKEIEEMKKAALIACEALNWISKKIEIGMTEKEVSNLISNKMLEMGASANSFNLIVASGANGSFPHHEASDKKISNNEFVTMDIGCIYNGYCSDITRTIPIGIPPKELIEAYKIVYQANAMGIKKAHQNISGKDLDKVCRDFISGTKFKNYFNHSTGHGVGIEVHEFPNVSPTYENKILNNSVITIEPGIYIPNLGGIRIEDMVLINNDEPIVLTAHAPKWLDF